MTEKTIVNAILKYLRTLSECFCWKQFGGMYSQSGLPDIIVCYKGQFLAFEVKSEKGKASKLQEATIRKIIDSGGYATVVRSVEEVKEILNTKFILEK